MSQQQKPRRTTDLPAVIDGSEPTAVQIVWQNVWVRAVSYFVLTVVLVLLLWHLRHGYAFALQVGVIGFLIAYILHPVVAWLGRLRVGRGLAVAITYGLLLLLLAFGSLVVSQVVAETGRFVQLIPSALDSVGERFTSLQEWFVRLGERLPDFFTSRLGEADEGSEIAVQIRAQFQSFLEQLVRGMQGLLQKLITGGPGLLLSGATAVISTTFQIFLILLAGAYFLYDFPRFSAAFKRLVPVRYRDLSQDLLHKADLAVGGYLRGQLLITMILGVMIWIGLTLIGIPLATAISFLAAVFNLVPYLGPILGVVPAVMLGLTVSPLAALLAILVFTLANQLEAHLLSPLILSRSTNLHPITVMLAIMAGVGLMGLLGALVAVPLVALVKVIVDDYVLTRPAFTGVAHGRAALAAEAAAQPPDAPEFPEAPHDDADQA
jgi:predicted PurR-regulated permease PerM